MPLHDFECVTCKNVTEHVVAAGVNLRVCPKCMSPAYKVFLRAPAGFVQADICYDSPIDGRAITNKHARIEDLKRNECVPFESGMKQDVERRRLESDRALDKSLDNSVEEFFATAPVRKREKLEQELRAGAAVEVERTSSAT